MTTRENQICRMLMKKKRSKEIAFELNISLNTVKAHLANIYRKNKLNGIHELLIYLLTRDKPLN